jgi:hypothetical protein
MKCVSYSAHTYDMGTNPNGGICIEVLPENLEEAKFLGFDKLTHRNFYGEERPNTQTVYKRLTSHHGGIPDDGGQNPEWARLQEYLGLDPIAWAAAAIPKR